MDIGLIGLGLLGNSLASRLLASGFAVIGFDLVPAAVSPRSNGRPRCRIASSCCRCLPQESACRTPVSASPASIRG
jgi:3-hydroxyisobutyrate dehydrogenase-like beta-hydroxyacid dehydrogenase